MQKKRITEMEIEILLFDSYTSRFISWKTHSQASHHQLTHPAGSGRACLVAHHFLIPFSSLLSGLTGTLLVMFIT